MPVRLKVMRYRAKPPVAELSCLIDTTGTLGRAADNDLVLDDPGKYISRRHACVERREEGYYLVDTGSNPSVLNERLLGQGQETLLQTGDVLEIGDYQIEVELLADQVIDPALDRVGETQTLAVFMPAPWSPPERAPMPEALPETASLPELDLSVERAQVPLLEGAPALSTQPDPDAVRSDHLPPELQPLPLTALQAPFNGGAGLIPEGYDALADRVTPPPGLAPSDLDLPPVADCRVIKALLEGLGLPQLHSVRSPEALARLVGEMLREATSGSMRLLRARALAKREWQSEMTLIGALGNNPLKCFPDALGALGQMLVTDSPGYLPGVQALRAGFDDLKAHEQAVATSTRQALAEVVHCLEPARIAGGLPTNGVRERLWPARRKARLWARYAKRYEALVGDGDACLQRLFVERFSALYSLQVNRLREKS